MHYDGENSAPKQQSYSKNKCEMNSWLKKEIFKINYFRQLVVDLII